jgi:hypothetical protein
MQKKLFTTRSRTWTTKATALIENGDGDDDRTLI